MICRLRISRARGEVWCALKERYLHTRRETCDGSRRAHPHPIGRGCCCYHTFDCGLQVGRHLQTLQTLVELPHAAQQQYYFFHPSFIHPRSQVCMYSVPLVSSNSPVPSPALFSERQRHFAGKTTCLLPFLPQQAKTHQISSRIAIAIRVEPVNDKSR